MYDGSGKYGFDGDSFGEMFDEQSQGGRGKGRFRRMTKDSSESCAYLCAMKRSNISDLLQDRTCPQ